MGRPLKKPLTPFGGRLREVREAHAIHLGKAKMDHPEFAALLGLGTTRYGNYEAGKRQPDLQVLAKIQSVTNCDLNWLITGKERKIAEPHPPRATPTPVKLQPAGARANR